MSSAKKIKSAEAFKIADPDTKKKQKAVVTLLLDRSSSMNAVRKQTVDAINGWLSELRVSGLNIRFNQIHFDYMLDEGLCLDKIHEGRKISEVPDMRMEDYIPRGGTPLIDAAVTTILALRESIGSRDVKVIMAIQTDGQELDSTRYRWSDLRELISTCEAAGWQFVFMGAGINAYDQASLMGMKAGQTISYGNSHEHTSMAFRSTARNLVDYASGMSADISYSDQQKSLSGDIYDNARLPPQQPAIVTGATRMREAPSPIGLGRAGRRSDMQKHDVVRDPVANASPAYPGMFVGGYVHGPRSGDILGQPYLDAMNRKVSMGPEDVDLAAPFTIAFNASDFPSGENAEKL